MSKRRDNESFFLGNSSANIFRGGANFAALLINNLDAAANTLAIYAGLWKPWLYPSLVSADGATYLFQSLAAPLGAVIGAPEYVAQHATLGYGIQMYTGGLANQASVYWHDLTTWSVEWFFTTGNDVTTQSTLWATYFVLTSSPALTMVVSGGHLVLFSTGTLTGPVVAANSTYHCVAVLSGGVVTFYLNNAVSVGTGTAPPAQAVGATPGLHIFNPSGGAMGFLSAWRGVALTAAQVSNHYQAYSSAIYFQTFYTATIAANGNVNLLLGAGGSLPFPDWLDVSFAGNAIVTAELES